MLLFGFLHTTLLKCLYHIERLFNPPISISVDNLKDESESQLTEPGNVLMERYNREMIPYRHLLCYAKAPNDYRIRLVVDRIILRRLLLIEEVVDRFFKPAPDLRLDTSRWMGMASAMCIIPSFNTETAVSRTMFCKLRSEFDWEIAAILLEVTNRLTHEEAEKFLAYIAPIKEKLVYDLSIERAIFDNIVTMKAKTESNNYGHSGYHP